MGETARDDAVSLPIADITRKFSLWAIAGLSRPQAGRQLPAASRPVDLKARSQFLDVGWAFLPVYASMSAKGGQPTIKSTSLSAVGNLGRQIALVDDRPLL